MRMKIILVAGGLAFTGSLRAQDSVKTIVLQEVVTTGTKFDLPVEKSGKTIFKLSADDLQRTAGKSVADVLNTVPGVQIDGNFGTPGTNISYYVRGARNRQTLILINGIPLNDPSAVTAEYDLRYLPLDQISSIEVLKGGLSTLYGTGAAAGVIDIRLKTPVDKRIGGELNVNAGSFNTFGQHLQAGGSSGSLSYFLMADNKLSKGFSSAEEEAPGTSFDRDSFSRQNVFASVKNSFSDAFDLEFFSAYETFDADYDAYEFTDAPYVQRFQQLRIGLRPKMTYGKGAVEGRLAVNRNERVFDSDFPASYDGTNIQADVTQKHDFSNVLHGLWGLNYQFMSFDEKDAVSSDTARMHTFDPYVSLLLDLPAGFNLHAGLRLNTHSLYGSKLVYNINPSYLLNAEGRLQYKVLASVSTSYVTPSLYQLYSIYGNTGLRPEEAFNVEAGVSVYQGERLEMNVVYFNRNEQEPIDFVSIFDEQGNYVGGQYQNLTAERRVYGVEFDGRYTITRSVSITAYATFADTDKEETFYRIPHVKTGAGVAFAPAKDISLSLTYGFTGVRTVIDFRTFSPVDLDRYQLVDLFASWTIIPNALTLYGAVNNLFDEPFIAVLGYTTIGRNYNGGLRYAF